MIVWETNDKETGLDGKNSELEDMQNEEPSFGTDHKSVRQLQEKLRDRESKDTNSIEWMTRDPLPRRSPCLEKKRAAIKDMKPVKNETLGVVQNEEGLQQSL